MKNNVCSADEVERIQCEIESEVEDSYIEYDISSYPAFYTLEHYANKYDSNSEVFVVPDFQRHIVWNRDQQSKLIESFFMGIPVPSVFLYTEDGKQFKIIDGQQRINTVWSYLNNDFPIQNPKSPYYNMKFINLDSANQEKLKNVVLPATVIRQSNPKDNSSIYIIFERLNTGGTKLNNMEVRRCVAYGAFLNTIEKANEIDSWRNLLGSSAETMRKKFLDLELVLRCFALYEENYKSPMKKFLNAYMETNKKDEKKSVSDIFISSVNSIYKSLGYNPFSVGGTGRPNYTLLDSVIVTVMKNNGKTCKGFADKFKALVASSEYKTIFAPGQGTMSEKSITDRLRIAKEKLC